MLRLNVADVSVESFTLQESDPDVLPTNDPTPATHCRWCPEPTFTCP